VVKKLSAIFKTFPWEAVVWAFSLILLTTYSPASDAHITLCPFKLLGFDFCPGCGLGRSISFFLHAEFESSFATHPLGGFAILILLFRIFQLLKNHFKSYGTCN
jgi:hypothetical protein